MMLPGIEKIVKYNELWMLDGRLALPEGRHHPRWPWDEHQSQQPVVIELWFQGVHSSQL